eukprot:659433-Hanusia_phi.AAC.1
MSSSHLLSPTQRQFHQPSEHMICHLQATDLPSHHHHVMARGSCPSPGKRHRARASLSLLEARIMITVCLGAGLSPSHRRGRRSGSESDHRVTPPQRQPGGEPAELTVASPARQVEPFNGPEL